MPEDLLTWELVGAAGALGTAAFGIVDGMKWIRRIGRAGFGEIEKLLAPFAMTLTAAFGPGAWTVLEAEYRDSRCKGELPRLLRQGVRIGLRESNAVDVAGALDGAVDGGKLEEAAKAVEAGTALSDAQRQVIARYELAVDARIDGALGAAESFYVGSSRVLAMVVAVLLALIAGALLPEAPGAGDALGSWFRYYLIAVLVGLAAVPVAPVAKDIASGLNAAVKALRGAK